MLKTVAAWKQVMVLQIYESSIQCFALLDDFILVKKLFQRKVLLVQNCIHLANRKRKLGMWDGDVQVYLLVNFHNSPEMVKKIVNK